MHIVRHKAIFSFKNRTAIVHAQLAAGYLRWRLPGIFPMVRHIRHAAAGLIHSPKFFLRAENRISFADGDQPFDKSKKFLFPFQFPPVQPSRQIILAIDIVVTLLGIGKFIACQNAGRPLRQQHKGERVLHLPVAQFQDAFFSCRPFCPAVPAEIIVRSILVILPIGFVMLAIIGNQVAQGEAIMVRYIIKYSFLSGIMPKPMHDLRHHALVPF